jgi:hypothetical protein
MSSESAYLFSYVLLGCESLLVAIALVYHAKVRMPRPAIGVYNRADILIMSLLVVVMPVIYVAISGAIVSAFFCLICYAALQVTIAPLARGRASWLIAAGLCAADLVATEWGGPHQALFVNDVVIGIAVVGAANLWVQSGMRSAHIAWFAGFLAVYDFVATSVTSSTDDFIARVSGIPFSPEWVFTLGPNPVAIGLGDLLLLSVFPLAAHRSFGAVAGIVAMATGTAVVAADTVAYHYGVLHGAAPVLTVLGPLVVVQHHLWRRARGRERTTGEWRRNAVPVAAGAVLADHDIRSTDAVPLPDGPTGFWAAIDGTRVVGVAPTPGAARRKARENGCTAVPQVREITAT